MFSLPVPAASFEALLEDIGARSRLAPIRTAAHAAFARRHSRRSFPGRREDTAALAAILGAAEDPFPALRHHF